jgi:cyclophilin family peptidyl-prolyl cis-trans isomerase
MIITRTRLRKARIRGLGFLLPALVLTTTLLSGCKSEPKENMKYVEIDTDYGRMVVKLYNETPGHRDNFLKLVNEGFYDSTQFHRVIPTFMIQGGDPNSKSGAPETHGQGGPGYTIPAEFNAALFHKRGALAAARQADSVNPERESSGSQFYIVQGRVMQDEELTVMESQLQQRIGADFKITPEARAAYTSVGGVPFLDSQYTVFGELVEGLDILDRIAAADTYRSTGEGGNPALADHPVEAIRMTMKELSNYAPPEGATE